MPPNVDRWSRAKLGAARQVVWLDREGHAREAEQVRSCAGFLSFRHGMRTRTTHMQRGFFCQHHKLCAVCAIRRAARLLRLLAEKIAHRRGERSALIPYLVTFTRRHVHAGWVPAIERILEAHRRLLGRRRQHLSRGNGWTEAARAEGIFWALEAKRGTGDGLPHPHIHAVWLCSTAPSGEALRREWHALTGDSDQVDVRPLHSVEAAEAAGAAIDAGAMAGDLAEVCKYITKFSEMDPADVWYLHANTQRRHFTGSVGALRFSAAEVEAMESQTQRAAEDAGRADEPYVELLYRWSGRRGGRYEEIDVLPDAGQPDAIEAHVRDVIVAHDATDQRRRMTERYRPAAVA